MTRRAQSLRRDSPAVHIDQGLDTRLLLGRTGNLQSISFEETSAAGLGRPLAYLARKDGTSVYDRTGQARTTMRQTDPDHPVESSLQSQLRPEQPSGR